jgi:hypothetical protein
MPPASTTKAKAKPSARKAPAAPAAQQHQLPKAPDGAPLARLHSNTQRILAELRALR